MYFSSPMRCSGFSFFLYHYLGPPVAFVCSLQVFSQEAHAYSSFLLCNFRLYPSFNNVSLGHYTIIVFQWLRPVFLDLDQAFDSDLPIIMPTDEMRRSVKAGFTDIESGPGIQTLFFLSFPLPYSFQRSTLLAIIRAIPCSVLSQPRF